MQSVGNRPSLVADVRAVPPAAARTVAHLDRGHADLSAAGRAARMAGQEVPHHALVIDA